MAIYTETKQGNWHSDQDNAAIPNAPSNRRYQQMLAEVARGESTQIPYTPPKTTQAEAQAAIYALYDDAIKLLQNGYSDQEEKTFSAKEFSAERRKNGTDTPLDRVSLAKWHGLLQGQVILTEADVAAQDLVIQALPSHLAAIDVRAQKITDASIRFRTLSGDIEDLRNQHLDQLASAEDLDAVVNSLAQQYTALAQALAGA